MEDSYLTISGNGDAVIEVKRSRFIGALRAVSSSDEAEAFLLSEKKKYHDAKHHCSAYIIRGTDGAPDNIHSSDDGEPSGTAGKPMLEVIKGAGLKDVVIVVTRYFGGTLLGTGGLVRAYTDAAKAAVSDAGIAEMILMRNFSVTFDYTHTGSVDHFINHNDVSKLDASYTEKVSYSLAVKDGRYDGIIKELMDITSSGITVDKGDTTYVMVSPQNG
ncbi:MAG: YigZ family protein [Lachnospiraceae bacterium]|nr:YigZ family protein [Lachnospiraceae bacterium]